MAEAKHTPGPWLADGASVYEERDDFSVICNFWSSSLPEWEANARLIAAAPDLLLVSMMYVDLLKMDFECPQERQDHFNKLQYIAEQAIAKAKRGE